MNGPQVVHEVAIIAQIEFYVGHGPSMYFELAFGSLLLSIFNSRQCIQNQIYVKAEKASQEKKQTRCHHFSKDHGEVVGQKEGDIKDGLKAQDQAWNHIKRHNATSH